MTGSFTSASFIARVAALMAALIVKQVLLRLDQQRIHAAGDQAAELLGVAVLQRVQGGVPKRRQLRPRADRADDETRLLRRVEFLAGFARNLGGHAC